MILCCGEALVDMVAEQTASGAKAFVPHAGGAVMNTAVALGRLGVPSGFLCGLSDDLFAATLTAHMAASHVDFAASPVYAAPTTLAFVELVDGQANYAFFDENTALRKLAEADLPQDLSGIDALFFGGISLAYGDCADAYEALMLRASDSHVTMIDPNIRAGFIRNEAQYRGRLERMIAVADVIKLSDEDLLWLEGAGDVAELAKGILARGPKLVLITEGSKGATAYHADFAVSRPVVPVDLSNSDTIGAGDTFNGGFLASLHGQGALTKQAVAQMGADTASAAVDHAIRAAAITVSRKGANPPWAHEMPDS